MDLASERLHSVLFALALALAACTPAAAPEGFRTVELVHRVSGRQEKETITYGADALKLARPGETYVLRYPDRTVFVLNDVDKAYREVSLDQFLSEGREQGKLPDLPDLVRSLGGGAGFQIEKTGQESEFGGVKGRLVRITGQNVNVELFLTEEVSLPGPRRPTFEFLQALGGPLALPAVLFDNVPGFPIRSIVRIQGGGFPEVKVARSLLSLERAEAPGLEFEPPEGYRRTGG